MEYYVNTDRNELIKSFETFIINYSYNKNIKYGLIKKEIRNYINNSYIPYNSFNSSIGINCDMEEEEILRWLIPGYYDVPSGTELMN